MDVKLMMTMTISHIHQYKPNPNFSETDDMKQDDEQILRFFS